MIRCSIYNSKEWMAAYIQGSLSRENMLLADAFLQKHPHLMDEYLQELEEFSLVPEDIFTPSFKELEIIVTPTSTINQHNFSAYFISCHEGLLTSSDQIELDQFLQLNPKLEKEFKVYGATQLIADNSIQFPDKKSLYKKSRPAIPLFFRYAAAASVLIVISLFVFWPSKEQNGIAFRDSGNTNIPSISIADNVEGTNQQMVNTTVNRVEKNKEIPQKQNRSIQTNHQHATIAKIEMAINSPVTIHMSYPSMADTRPEITLQDIKPIIVIDYVDDNTVAENKPKKKGLFNKLFSGEKIYIEDYVNATFTAFNGNKEDTKWVLKVERDKNGKSKRVKFTSPIFSAKSAN
jgi:hypothetical protein